MIDVLFADKMISESNNVITYTLQVRLIKNVSLTKRQRFSHPLLPVLVQTDPMTASARPSNYHYVVDEPLLHTIAAEIQAAIPGAEVRLFGSRDVERQVAGHVAAAPPGLILILIYWSPCPMPGWPAIRGLWKRMPWVGSSPITGSRLNCCSSPPARLRSGGMGVSM